jgi:hypothetical protein
MEPTIYCPFCKKPVDLVSCFEHDGDKDNNEGDVTYRYYHECEGRSICVIVDVPALIMDAVGVAKELTD